MSRVAVAGGTGTVGRLVVAALRGAGHEAVVLSRASGVDLLAGATPALLAALEGCDAVVDATGPTSLAASQTARGSRRFFERTTTALLEAGRTCGVGHHVALSIVGASRVDAALYAGKARQEQLVSQHDGGWTLLRTTQFHELVPVLAGLARTGPVRLVPAFTSQPLAAAEAADELARLAAGPPQGAVADLAGPLVERVPELARRWLAVTRRPGRVVEVPLPGRFGTALRTGQALPGAGARLARTTFAEWLAGQRPAGPGRPGEPVRR
ncbi:SDR family oxidoreductase [Quadrisphaera sp. INWT6]|uniref:SDR family oxidoreductase n=1 Tax=Quadrisphaera sp. INWT6 TaxID=2596917 RepID=UPI00189220C1|nr:NAD-dependent epimerase/dehydratase family protein [Quadrisphaera sp. INWT6]MBF5080508.1 NAD(P)H-binding protein [Quadrisphaera sp. INWT6]